MIPASGSAGVTAADFPDATTAAPVATASPAAAASATKRKEKSKPAAVAAAKMKKGTVKSEPVSTVAAVASATKSKVKTQPGAVTDAAAVVVAAPGGAAVTPAPSKRKSTNPRKKPARLSDVACDIPHDASSENGARGIPSGKRGKTTTATKGKAGEKATAETTRDGNAVAPLSSMLPPRWFLPAGLYSADFKMDARSGLAAAATGATGKVAAKKASALPVPHVPQRDILPLPLHTGANLLAGCVGMVGRSCGG